jgi:hypothetical protein
LQTNASKKVDRSTQDEHMHARAKFAEIQQILSPFYPQQFVQTVITRLVNEYNRTEDCSIPDTVLKNHRRNVESFLYAVLIYSNMETFHLLNRDM